MSKNKLPKISVIMPIYNCAKYLPEALASLQIQTFTDFEVVAINDGSTDGSLEILESFAKNDNRIRIISQKNSGIVAALNKGISEARAEYIARMDGDDVSFPNRFADQIKVLDKRPKVVLVAGNFEVINEESEFLYKEFVIPDNECIQRAFYLRNAIAHGSVMFRKTAVQKLGAYSDKCGPTEDMELWMRLLKQGEFMATNSFVYRWRVNQRGITSQNNIESRRIGQEHQKKRWNELPPIIINRSYILQKIKYLPESGEHDNRTYKKMFLIDSASIAIKGMFEFFNPTYIKQFASLLIASPLSCKIAIRQLLAMTKRFIIRLVSNH